MTRSSADCTSSDSLRLARGRRVRQTAERFARGSAIYLVLMAVAVIMIGPFAWMLSAAFKTEQGIFAYPPQWVPSPPTLANFAALSRNLPFSPSLVDGVFKPGIIGNTFAMAIAITVGQVATSAIAAFAFARLRFPGRDAVFLLFLAGLIVPLEVRMVP